MKYSQIRKTLNLQVDRHTSDDLASLTHFFQNHHFISDRKLERKVKALIYTHKLVEHEVFDTREQYLLPIKWDVPFPPPKEPKFTFIDLFAGIGGFRLAFQNLGGKCLFSSEWNHFAKKTYEANFGEIPYGDITNIAEGNIPDHNILLAGFPCQPFSIAGVSKKNSLGKKHGFLDETQGTLFFDIARILRKKRPSAFILENVKNLKSHDGGKTFKVIEKTLRDLRYSVFYKVLDGRYFVPQHRERIFIIGFNDDQFGKELRYSFPTLPNSDLSVKNILEANVNRKYTLSDKLWKYLQNYANKHKEQGNGFGYGLTNLNGVTRTLSARYFKDGAEILIPQKDNNPRRLTPKECARLQGYPEEFVIPVSDNQAYKQFGNSVTVPLVEFIGKSVLAELKRAQWKA